MVFYRKYRPTKLSDLDNRRVKEALLSILSKDVPHAFIFAGPKGLGKTSAARIVAKTINCEKRLNNKKQIEACDSCEQCMSITNGSNMDVLEIDAASNRGIDQIRELKESIKLLPIKASKKIYIIDEAHMLTKEAFNALLKTLEEPPSHAIFVLCTTEPHKVPETILSRCFYIPFKAVSKDEIIDSLKRIVVREKISIDSKALDRIAYLSDGSFRDAAKILEEIVLSADSREIDDKMVEAKYGISGINLQVRKLLELIIKADIKEIMIMFSLMVKDGINLTYFLEELLVFLHQLMLFRLGIETVDEDKRFNAFSLEDISRLTRFLVKANQELKYAVIEELPIELAILDFLRSDSKKEEKKEIKQIENVDTQKIISGKDVLKNGLVKLIDMIKQSNYALAGILRGCDIKSYVKGDLILETKFKFHKDKLDDPKNLRLLEKVFLETYLEPARIKVILKDA